jgi:membrane-associated protease RseP (regulator of RpoE activity)
MASRHRFWRGRIESAEHALKIIRMAAIGFGVFAALILLTQMEDLGVGNLSVVAILALCALALLLARSVWAARILILLIGPLAALLVAIPVFWLIEKESPPYIVLFGVLALPFVLALVAALRAHAAAMFLRDRRGSDVA